MPLTRRDFLKASGLFAAWMALSACDPREKTALSPTRAAALPTASPAALLNEDALITHTLRRMTFAPTAEMLAKARRIGLEAFIEEQLQPESIPDAETDQLLSRFSTLTMSAAERLQQPQRGKPVQEIIAATLLRQWHSERQLFEMTADFWSNHFNIFIGKSLCRALKTDDDLQVIRPNAFGKFGELLKASAHSPAMLIFLDNAQSKSGAPNENYARELMELHTISVDGGYTQQDVTEVARALTGWTIFGPRKITQDAGTFVFNQRVHDDGEKHVLGLTIPAGGGEQDGNLLLDMLAHHPLAARFISTKLARRFVSDSPGAALVDALAETFTRSDGDTRAVLRAMFKSDAFKASAGQKVKRPLEFLVSTLRLTDATFTARPQQLVNHLKLLGQVPFNWEAPNGFPDVAAFWLNSSGLLERWNVGMLLTSGQMDGARVDLKALTKEAGSAQDVVDVLSLRFIGEQLPETARSILVDYAAQGDLGGNLAGVAGLILGSPYFQVR